MPHPKVTKSSDRYQPYDLARRPLHVEGSASGRTVREAPTIDLRNYRLRDSKNDSAQTWLANDANLPKQVTLVVEGLEWGNVYCDTTSPDEILAEASLSQISNNTMVVLPSKNDDRWNFDAPFRATFKGRLRCLGQLTTGNNCSPLDLPLGTPKMDYREFVGLCRAYNQSRTPPTILPPSPFTDVTSSPSSDAPTEGDGGLSPGGIAGLTLGVSFLVGFVVIGGVLGGCYIYRKCRPLPPSAVTTNSHALEEA